jgi:hypothetical protein
VPIRHWDRQPWSHVFDQERQQQRQPANLPDRPNYLHLINLPKTYVNLRMSFCLTPDKISSKPFIESINFYSFQPVSAS